MRRLRKRANTVNHFIRDGVWQAELGGVTRDIVTPTLMDLENTRYNFESERPVNEIIAERLRPTDVVWDVGAGYGTEAVLFADMVAEVVAIEADAARVNSIELNANRNDVDNVTTQGILLGSSADVDAVRDTCPDPTVVRLDVEGAEYDVLHALEDVLDGVRLVSVEVHPTMMDGDESAVSRVLTARGFDVTRGHDRGTQFFLTGRRE